MSGYHSNTNEQMHSPLKTMVGKIGNSYQSCCTVYKMHAMVTHHRGTGHPIGRDLHIEDPEATGIDNKNESISGSDVTVALCRLEAEGNPDEHLPSYQAKMTTLIQEINELCQQVEAREQPAESLDHIYWELQKLFLALQPPHSPTPTELLWEVICQYMDTLCMTQKQTNITNSLLQDIAVLNEYDSPKLED